MRYVGKEANRQDEWQMPNWRLPLRTLGDAVYRWDVPSGRMEWQHPVAAVWPLSSDDTGSTIEAYLARLLPDDRPARELALARGLRERKPISCEFKMRRGDGSVDWVEERIVPDVNGYGAVTTVSGVLRRITERKNREGELERLAYYDDLTGHVNRTHLRELLNSFFAQAPNVPRAGGFLLANIDNLGRVNEAYGYDVADQIIIAIGERVKEQLHPADCVGRAGGNQFAAIINDCDRASIAALAENILQSVRANIVETDAGAIGVTLSIGGVLIPEDAKDCNATFGCAEEALERAKQAGRDRFDCYQASTERQRKRVKMLATGDKVMSALKDRRLRLAYQPIVAADTGETVMYESLMRMLDDNGEVVPAAAFMPVVEKLGLVRLLDRRTLEMALEELTAAEDISLTVNISGITAMDANCMADLVAMVTEQVHVAPRLTFEITETAAIQDLEESAGFVKNIRDLGCSIALDDFGAGYTSFRHFKALAVDMVKLDGQFVRNLATSPENQLFVETLLNLANGFGLRTVAECIETAEDAAALRERGVDYLQGYFFGAPYLDRPWKSHTTPSSQAPIRAEA